MHRHWVLCARAVDPLEIAAALEAQGVTDRVAARYRHRDVFSLAEELFARVPRAEGRSFDAPVEAPAPSAFASASASASGYASVAAERAARRASPRVLLPLLPLLAVLPGVVCAAAVAVPATAGSVGSAASPGVARTGLAVAVGLACALGPALWCVRWFAVRAGRRLELSRSLDEFASGMRPLLTAAVVLFTGALTGLQLAAREIEALAVPRSAVPAAGLLPVVSALGVLLFAALLLAAHGFRGAAASGLVAACALQAAAASATGSASPSVPAYAVAAACGCAALFLLACAYRLLSRASAHLIRADAGRLRERREHRRRRRHRGHCGHRGCCEPGGSPGGRPL